MAIDQPLNRRIMDLYDDLPRGERRLADLVLSRLQELGNYSAGELAEQAGVSRATAARFFKRLGYLNFRSAREASRNGGPQRHRPATPGPESGPAQAGSDPGLHLSSDIQNLRHTFESLRPELLGRVVEALAGAGKLWVVGFDDDYALAHFARSLLIRIKPDIRMLPLGGFSVPEEFASITPQDVILGFGIRRQPESLRRILRSGRDAGAQIILVTGEGSSQGPALRGPATLVLPCRTRGASLFESLSAPLSLITYICSAAAATLGEPAVERLHRIESLHNSWGEAELEEG